jgi:hypothetical protein
VWRLVSQDPGWRLLCQDSALWLVSQYSVTAALASAKIACLCAVRLGVCDCLSLWSEAESVCVSVFCAGRLRLEFSCNKSRSTSRRRPRTRTKTGAAKSQKARLYEEQVRRSRCCEGEITTHHTTSPPRYTASPRPAGRAEQGGVFERCTRCQKCPVKCREVQASGREALGPRSGAPGCEARCRPCAPRSGREAVAVHLFRHRPRRRAWAGSAGQKQEEHVRRCRVQQKTIRPPSLQK